MTLDQIFDSWGGASYPAYDGQANSAVTVAPPATSPAVGSGAPAPGSPTGAEGEGLTPGASPTPPDPKAENLRQLREGYERYSKLGKPEELETSHQVYSNLVKTWSASAKELGYDEADFRKAFASNPVGTIDLLRKELAAAKQNQPRGAEDIQKLIDKRVNDAVKPFTEQMNVQKTNEANALFDTTTNGLISKDFKDYPGDVTDFLYDITSTLMQEDAESLKALKTDGKTAGINQHYAKAKDIFLRVVTAYNKHEAEKRGGAPVTQGAKGGEGAVSGKEKLTLDDIINDSPKAKGRLTTFR